jgi:hypothetical protein
MPLSARDNELLTWKRIEKMDLAQHRPLAALITAVCTSSVPKPSRKTCLPTARVREGEFHGIDIPTRRRS